MLKINFIAAAIIGSIFVLTGNIMGQEIVKTHKKPVMVAPIKSGVTVTQDNLTRSNRRKFDHIGNFNLRATNPKTTTTQIGADMMEGTNIKQKQPDGQTKSPKQFFRPSPSGDGTTQHFFRNGQTDSSSSSSPKSKLKKPLRLVEDNDETADIDENAEVAVEESLGGSQPSDPSAPLDPSTRQKRVNKLIAPAKTSNRLNSQNIPSVIIRPD